MDKKRNGQFYTVNNPFGLDGFRKWFGFLGAEAKLLEPFAGANNLVRMVNEIYGEREWASFDIKPSDKSVIKKDTLEEMPEGFDAIITNPPYLARNSATRSGIRFSAENHYDDLYKFCLDKMLVKYDFVAAIIPESFITSGQFREKLFATISLTQNMFSDTDCPVCIAMFVDLKTKGKYLASKDFYVYQLDKLIGRFSDIYGYYRKEILDKMPAKPIRFKFNDREGEIGLWGVDNTKGNSIHFGDGAIIPPEKIKVSSRAITRISSDSSFDVDRIAGRANAILEDFRKNTNDIFMTAFKGLRADGRYRRRLDYKIAGQILNVAA